MLKQIGGYLAVAGLGFGAALAVQAPAAPMKPVEIPGVVLSASEDAQVMAIVQARGAMDWTAITCHKEPCSRDGKTSMCSVCRVSGLKP